MRYLSLVFLFFSAKMLCYSQGNFTPGFYIANGGETVRGFFQYQRWDVSPSVILFKKSNSNYVDERKDASAELGIVVGASSSTISFSEKLSYDYLYKANYSGSVRPTVGFYCDFKLLRTLGMKLGNDLLYSSFRIKGSGITGVNGSTTQTTIATFNYHYFKTHHMIQINLMRNGSLYAAGGCSLGFVLNNEDDVSVVYNMTSISKREFISKPFEIGYVLGIGTRYEKWSLELKYEKSSGITDYPPGKTMRFHMLLRCRLFG